MSGPLRIVPGLRIQAVPNRVAAKSSGLTPHSRPSSPVVVDPSLIDTEDYSAGVELPDTLFGPYLGAGLDTSRKSRKQQKRAKKKYKVRTALLLAHSISLCDLQQYMADWMRRRDSYLDELHRQDGWTSLDEPDAAVCPRCPVPPTSLPALYRCTSCMGSPVVCRRCIVHNHAHSPFHRVQVRLLPVQRVFILDLIWWQIWNTQFWQQIPLGELGLVIHVRHDGRPCPAARTTMKFILVNGTGLHRFNLAFCGCKILDPHIQLLRSGFYPSTEEQPRSAWSFSFLDTFHKITLQGKLPLYDYYLSVLHLSNNASTTDVLVRGHLIPFDTVIGIYSTAWLVDPPFARNASMAPPQDAAPRRSRACAHRHRRDSAWRARNQMPRMPAGRRKPSTRLSKRAVQGSIRIFSLCLLRPTLN
jgi:hypothetical protein